MIITEIKQKGQNILITLSDRSAISCPKSIFYNVEIYEGMEVDNDDVRYLIEKSAEEAARNKAMTLLANNMMSEFQLKNKLRTKKYPERLIKDAVKFCKEYDLIDDKRFAKIALISLLKKRKSRRSIYNYLKRAGVSTRIIEKMTDKVTDRRERISIDKNIVKYYPFYSSKKDPEKSLLQYLIGKGFNYGAASKRVKKYFEKMNTENKTQ